MEKEEELLMTLGDFTSKENWDKFFTLRGNSDPFEWYVEWSNLQEPLVHQLANDGDDIQILVPGCGNSQVSEKLYDSGFHNITNIDFSKIVVSEMLRQHLRSRPKMRWRVMDMTHLQFADGSFDVVLDKGGLDALMEPELGPKLGNQYLTEVKRVLKSRGKYICLTLAESHVLGLVFSKFRLGWEINLHPIPGKPPGKAAYQTFMLVVTRGSSSLPNLIMPLFDPSALHADGNQIHGLIKAIETENKIRSECSSGADIVYSLEDLQLGSQEDLVQFVPGRRFLLTLGGSVTSNFSYKAVILDSKDQDESFLYHCAVFLVPKNRAHEWLFSSSEGQWEVVESAKSARLIMIFLDKGFDHVGMDEIQKDLSPLVRYLQPGKDVKGPQIPFLTSDDGVKQRKIVQQVTSTTTGVITVEDVTYEEKDVNANDHEQKIFRRLSFERNLGLVQSEALLTRREISQKDVSERGRKKTSSSKSRKKSSQRQEDTRLPLTDDSRSNIKIDHNYLSSSYYNGIIAGFSLVASVLKNAASFGGTVKTVVIGLGAGLLPMFLHENLSFLDIEVVELDPVVFNLARDYFGFTEGKQLKVHIGDGIQFVEEGANSLASLPKGNGTESCSVTETWERNKIQILIIDADSADVSTGLTCPPANFTEESFLISVKRSLSNGGLFIINLVSRSPSIRGMVASRLKTVFSHVYCLEIEEDVNEVLFALPTETCSTHDHFSEGAVWLEKLFKFRNSVTGLGISETADKIKRLK